MHPITAKKVDFENKDLHHILLPNGQGMVPRGSQPEADQIHFLNGLPLVRDPRMPIGMICILHDR
jgi:hypothetical protein